MGHFFFRRASFLTKALCSGERRPSCNAASTAAASFVSMAWHRPKSAPEIWFYVGLALAAFGAALVLRFKPS